MPQINNSAEIQEEFKRFYEVNLRHKYEQLEPKRQQYLKKFKKIFSVCASLFAIMVILCATGVIPEKICDSFGFFGFCAALLLLAAALCSIPFAEYRAATKAAVMKKILSFWGNFSYSRRRSKINITDLRNSGLFQDFDCDITDDSFQGTYHNTEICVAEKDLAVKGEKSERNVFEGIVILLGFNKKFKGKTVVKHKGFFFPLQKFFKRCNSFSLLTVTLIFVCSFIFSIFFPFVFIGIMEHTVLSAFLFFASIIMIALFILYIRNKDTEEIVILEGAEFNRKWHVTTNNQVEARYILTPILMEKINDIKKLFQGKYVDFGFFNNKLLIAVHTKKNMFETTSLFVPAADYHKVSDVVNQLYGIFSVADILNSKNKHQPEKEKINEQAQL